MRVLFAGTPDFAVPALQALSDKHEIIGVYTQPDRQSGRGKKVTPPPVKLAAASIIEEQGIGAEIYQPNSLKDQQTTIADLKPDVMVVVAYGMLLPQSILDIPTLGCINIHASILPRWRGAAPIHRAIEAGDQESGVAIMKMELGLDTGPVFQMLKTPILENETTESLHDKLSQLGATGIVETLDKLAQNPALKPQPQNGALATYAKKLTKQEAQIDWSEDAKQIDQKIRAFIPFPIAQSSFDGKRIRVWQASVIESQVVENATPGDVVDVSVDGVTVQCGKNRLKLEVLQRDGGKSLSWREFSNGFPINIGQRLT